MTTYLLINFFIMVFLGMFGGQEIILILLIFLLLLFPLIALISVLKGKFEGNDKLIWVLLILFLPFLGALLYFIIGSKKKIE